MLPPQPTSAALPGNVGVAGGIRLHFVRHGQSTWNAESRVQGQTPHVPLTAEGRRQAEAAAEELRGSGAGWVLTSDLLRARQTAAPIARALGVPARPEPALREQSLGTLEGRLASELTAQPPPDGAPAASIRWGGGESIADVHRRLSVFLRGLLADPPGGDIVLVSHGDTIRVAVACLRGLGPADVAWFDVPNGSVTTVRVPPR